MRRDLGMILPQGKVQKNVLTRDPVSLWFIHSSNSEVPSPLAEQGRTEKETVPALLELGIKLLTQFTI